MMPFIFRTSGPLRAGQELDNAIYPGLIGTIQQITLFCEQTGSAGDPLVCDVLKYGSSIFASDIVKPRILANIGANKKDLTPKQDIETRDFTSVTTYSVIVQSAPPGAETATLILWCDLQTDAVPVVFRTTLGAPIQPGPIDTAMFPGLAGEVVKVVGWTQNGGTTGDPLTIDVLKNGVSMLAAPVSFSRFEGPEDVEILAENLPDKFFGKNDWFHPVITAAPPDCGNVTLILWLKC